MQNVIANSYDVLRSNLDLTLNVLDLAFKQRHLSRLMFASTSEVYAGALDAGLLQIPTSESQRIILPELRAPRSSYMLSKIYGEDMNDCVNRHT